MAGTQVNMVRRTITLSGVPQYTIHATCVTRGTLDDKGIFVLGIDDRYDPKDDEFWRVAELSDFALYQDDRDRALEKKDEAWRSTDVLFTYTDVETANAAWKELSARINALVGANDTYIDEFETVDAGELLTYPTVDQATRTRLIDAFHAAETALTEAKKALSDKQALCSSHQSDLADLELTLQQAESDLKTYLQVQAALGAIYTTYVSIHAALASGNTQLRSLNNGSDAADIHQDAIDAQLAQDQAQLTLFSAQNTALGSVLNGGVTAAVTTLQTRVIAITTEKNDLRSHLNECSAEQARLEAQVTVAQEQRDQALTAVKAVCPDFDEG